MYPLFKTLFLFLSCGFYKSFLRYLYRKASFMQQSIDMYFMILDTSSLLNISTTYLKSHPVLLSSNPFLSFINKSCSTKDGLLHLLVYFLILPILHRCIFCTIQDHALVLCNSCATHSMCCLPDNIRITRRIRSFTSALRSSLYALSSTVVSTSNKV